MYYPQALWRPGPPQKVWPAVNAGLGVVMHSMVGYMPGAFRILDDPNGGSWHFSVTQEGVVCQHYLLTASAWHAGTRLANERFIGIEHEGGYEPFDEPLTPAQKEASIKLVRWVMQQLGKPISIGHTLLLHSQVFATACPSGRIPLFDYGFEPEPPPPGPPEDDVQVRPLSQGETIDALNAIAEKFGGIITDQNAQGAYEVKNHPVVGPGKIATLFVRDA